MKIVHVTSYYRESMGYQENYLPKGQQEIGNQVFIITSDVEFDFHINSNERRHMTGVSYVDGVEVHRIEHLIEFKNRFVIYKNLYKELELIAPDIVFFYDHSPALFTCIRYKKRSGCKLIVLFHSDKVNSMNSFIGKPYHKILWRTIIAYTQRYYDGVICGAPSCAEFARDIYRINSQLIKLIPLPGDASLMDDYNSIRDSMRKELGLKEDSIALMHTGKLPQKKRTKELLSAFCRLTKSNVILYIVGDIDDGFRDEFKTFCNRNSNIRYLGWKSADQLKRLFISADAMIQPGGLSNTYIDAICCGLPVILDDTEQGRLLTRIGNGFLIDGASEDEIERAIIRITEGDYLSGLKDKSMIASAEYHYIEIAKRTLE